MDEPNRQCQAKIGLLILRDCGAEARLVCYCCNRVICRQHRTKSPEGELCPECAVGKQVGKHSLSARRVQQRRHYYGSHGYRPYYYGYGDRDPFYGEYDYRTFDHERDVDHEPLEDIEPGLEDTDEGRDWIGVDDFGES